MKTHNNGIEMPEDFSCENYDEIFKIVHGLIKPSEPLPNVWIEFSSGWNAISFRYKAMCHHDEQFRNTLGDRGHEGRYIQERELFNFFVNSLSVLETFCYSIVSIR